MNKYRVEIPYSYLRYGTLSCYVNAEDYDEAEDLARDYDNRYSEDYNDGDDDGDTEYDYSGMEIELEEENISGRSGSPSRTGELEIPCYFIKDLVLI